MIINLRGTSGSGKSTVVRRIMELYEQRLAVKVEGRKQPVGYLLRRSEGRSLWVPGHYETACGGCDTLPSMEAVYDSVRRAAKEGHDVLYEGVIVTSDIKRCAQLHTDGFPLLVLGMSTTLVDCLEGITRRREHRGDARPINPDNTAAKLRTNEAGMRKLQDVGVDARWVGRNEAFEVVRCTLGMSGRQADGLTVSNWAMGEGAP